MKIFPTKSKLLLNFLSCINWEEKYMYIIDLGKLLPKFPENMRMKKYLISGCQNHTWIALIPSYKSKFKNCTYSIELHGDSDSSIVKGLITIIFSLYQELNLQEIQKFDIKPFLEKLQLKKNLTISRSQGIHAILNSIHAQAKHLEINKKYAK